jgi:uncharacterized protein YbjT (DUF2867 family)
MIVITTPTGQIGRQVLGNVLNSGKPIRVIVRDPSRLPSEARKRIDVVQGSHGDSDTVQKAFAGADTVFWLVPPDPKAESVEAAYVGFSRPACAAFKSQTPTDNEKRDFKSKFPTRKSSRLTSTMA